MELWEQTKDLRPGPYIPPSRNMCTATPVSCATWSQAFSAFNLAIARFSVGCGTELQKICKKKPAKIFSKPKDLPPLLHDVVSGDILCLQMVICVYNLQILDLCCNLLFIHPVAWPVSIYACKATSVTQLEFFVLMWNHAIIFQSDKLCRYMRISTHEKSCSFQRASKKESDSSSRRTVSKSSLLSKSESAWVLRVPVDER